MKNLFFFTLPFIFCFGCQNNLPESYSTDEFQLKDNFQIQCIAAEPLLDSPVAFQFDWEGRIWAVELPGYMRDIDGSEEKLPDGRIVILEDTDGDGVMDNRKIFLDSLLTPRTLALSKNGLLYAETPNLWWVNIEDDKPGKRILVDSLYVIGGNIEHQPNGLLYNLDNWWYSSKSNARYRYKNGKWEKEATTFRGQWGIANDTKGRLFYNNNSNPIYGDFTLPNKLIDNPYWRAKFGVQQNIVKDRRVFPIQATAVNRGYADGVLDEEEKLTTLTSACAPFIYYGDLYPTDYQGNAFVCAPEVNLIKRYVLEEEGGKISGTQAYDSTEFLISNDETFRPVNLYHGLDGAMYILDLRKGIIQHRAYMTNYLREKILDRGLEKINGKGRIYQIVPNENTAFDLPNFNKFSNQDFINLLQDSNGALRLKAQQKLVEEDDQNLSADIEKIALDNSNSLGQIHALWTLEGMDLLTFDILEKTYASTQNAAVITQIIYLSELFLEEERRVLRLLITAFTNPAIDAETFIAICHLAGKISPEIGEKFWLDLARGQRGNALFAEALISGISGNEQYYFEKIQTSPEQDSVKSFLNQILQNIENQEIKAPQLMTKEFEDDRTRGFNLYQTYCATCHGWDGKGNEKLAPPLENSEYIQGPDERLILTVLHGLQGPVTVDGKVYDMNLVMPGLKHNPDLSDDEIADILVFLRNSFSEYWQPIRGHQVKALRELTKDREAMFTEEELNTFVENLKSN